jgi:hypothetical protein
MSKVVIPSSALERILLRVRGMMADLKRPASDKEHALVEWLEKMTDEGDGNDMDSLVRKVGSLRSGWDRPLTAMEMHTLYGSSECLNDFSKLEWELMRDYLAYQPRPGEKFYQVKSREWFLKSPVDTLTAAEGWAQTHRRKPTAPRPQRHQEPERGEFSMEQFREIFTGLRAEDSPPPQPLPPPPGYGQNSLFDQ